MVRSFLPVPAPEGVSYSPLNVAIPVAEGLAARGHSVTFFAPESSSPKTNLKTLGIQPLVKSDSDFTKVVSSNDLFADYIPSLYDQNMSIAMFQAAMEGKFDVLLFHHPESSICLAKLFPNVPVVYTLHDFLDEKRRTMFDMNKSSNQHYISISNNQRLNAPNLPYAATIYNGIDPNIFSYNDIPDDYLMFAGRIVPEKGVSEAIQVAIRTNKKLVITGPLPYTSKEYFDKSIKPFLNDKITYVGLVGKSQLAKYYQKAIALLIPIAWEEPFGLTMTEAMSCGTPVIAFNRGSVPEVIEEGKTGFIVNDIDSMVKAVEKISSINRKDCRERVEKFFTIDDMVSNYEKVLLEIIAQSSLSK